MTQAERVDLVASQIEVGHRIGPIHHAVLDPANHRPTMETVGVFHDAEVPAATADQLPDGLLDRMFLGVATRRVQEYQDDIVAVALEDDQSGDPRMGVRIETVSRNGAFDPELARGAMSIILQEAGVPRAHVEVLGVDEPDEAAKVIGLLPDSHGGYMFERVAAAA